MIIILTQDEKEFLEFSRRAGSKIITLDDSNFDKILKSETYPKQSYSAKITEFLKELGLKANLNGFNYIKFAILKLLEDENFGKYGMTKSIYPKIAQEFNTTPSCVERAIRHSIEVAFSQGSINIHKKIFSFSINPLKGKPTNSEFFSTVTLYLKENIPY